MRCPTCEIPLSLASLEQIWRGPDFEHRLTYYCEACGLRFGREPYELAESILTQRVQGQNQTPPGNSRVGMNCNICGAEFLGQDSYPLKRCDRCKLWFELQDDELVPVRTKTSCYR
jgi:hypothetical protein